eukprot:scaffold16090_cov99-Isochrysis_galbana.AAC.1
MPRLPSALGLGGATPHTNSQRSMGSATWSQISSHAGSGEKESDDGRGDEESIRWGATHTVKWRNLRHPDWIQIHNSSVSSPCSADMRGRPSRSRARINSRKSQLG